MTERIGTKRIYDAADEADGTRVLVDGVWPRGMKKADARIDHWRRDLAPSRELRQWFSHEPRRWAAFREAYRDELAEQPGNLHALVALARGGPLTLIYSARDRWHNQAAVLAEVVREELAEADRANEPLPPVWYDDGRDGVDTGQ
jgi:uncharacterized protein YeaO (DUF488 family)